ncbi:isoform II [Clostridium estertheticum]|uniref:alpha/beta hydrolase family protein n=1 Tax=Clostridium estertheticum TaxID=238834 RepID=UPI0013E9481F|nr:carboxylic ester hydrolase [Clostridium estertheticum]MBZ9689871.1 isoform II [Clostridium estertheticum]
MRPLEIILITLNFTLLYWGILSGKRYKWNSVITLAVAFSSVAIQLVVEGGRWEMLPVYLIPLILTGYHFLFRRNGYTISKRTIIIQTTILTLYLLISIALPTSLPVFTLEKPTGQYLVGTTSHHWVDNTRKEPYSNNPKDKRELMVQIWYPTKEGNGKAQSPYIQNASKMLKAVPTSVLGVPAFILNSLEFVKTYAVPEASVSDSEASYPILIFSHGMLGFRNQNMFQVEELASHGYIVVGIDYTYDAASVVFPDGSVATNKMDEKLSGYRKFDEHISLWDDDFQFVLNKLQELNSKDTSGRFTGRMDMNKIGAFGHSFGGATSIQMLMKDSRVKAAIGMDAGLYGSLAPEKGIGKPFLMMLSEETTDKNNSTYEDFIKKGGKGDRQLFEAPRKEYTQRLKNALAGGGISILIPKTTHISYSDFTLYSPLLQLPIFGGRSENPRSVHKTINEFSVAFFDSYLKQEGNIQLNNLAIKHPEVNLTVNK